MDNMARATVKYVRISPRKVKIVLDLIRNQPADKAMAILRHTPKAASECHQKLQKSAKNLKQISLSVSVEVPH